MTSRNNNNTRLLKYYTRKRMCKTNSYAYLVIGDYIILEVYAGMSPIIPEIHLHRIPYELNVYGQLFTLGGVIDFVSSNLTRKSEAEMRKVAGHFRAVCIRANKTWQLFDDLIDHPLDINANCFVRPHAVLYFRTNTAAHI